jgi:hypothetical protein
MELLQPYLFCYLFQIKSFRFIFETQYDVIIVGKGFVFADSIRKLIGMFSSVIQDTAEAFCETDRVNRCAAPAPVIKNVSVRQLKLEQKSAIVMRIFDIHVVGMHPPSNCEKIKIRSGYQDTDCQGYQDRPKNSLIQLSEWIDAFLVQFHV